MKAVTMPKKTQADVEEIAKAHKSIKGFHHVCDLYNKGDFDDVDTLGKGMLKFYLGEVQITKKYVVYLFKKENCSTTRAYMDFVARIIIRLSSLIHNERKETTKERMEHMMAVRSKYGSYPPANTDTFEIINLNH